MDEIKRIQKENEMLKKQNEQLAKALSNARQAHNITKKQLIDAKTDLTIKDMKIESLEKTQKYLEDRCRVLNSVPEPQEAVDFLKNLTG